MKSDSLWGRLNPELLGLVETPEVAVETTDEGRFSRFGNWNGRETGTSPPNIPKPRGRDGPAELSRVLADDTCTRGKHH